MASGCLQWTDEISIYRCHSYQRPDCSVHLDTGAEVNTIYQRFVGRDQVKPTNQRLVMPNGTKMIPRGEETLSVYDKKSKLMHDIKFTVVENKFSCLLGLKTLKSLGFVTINEDHFLTNVRTGTCDLGDPCKVTLKTVPTKKPRQLLYRRVPFLVKMKDSCVFSQAYWHVRLDNQSSLITTMITPFGRFRWAFLLFALKVSSEIFPRKLWKVWKASKIPFLSRMACPRWVW